MKIISYLCKLLVCVLLLLTTNALKATESLVLPVSATASAHTVWGGTWYTGPANLAIDQNNITEWTLEGMGWIDFDLGSTKNIHEVRAYWGGSVSNGNCVNIYIDGTKVISNHKCGAYENVIPLDAPRSGRMIRYETIALPHNEYNQIATWSELAEFTVLVGTVDTDSDSDGLVDSVETNTGVWVSLSDTGTNPNNADTDGDGITDGNEVYQYLTNPNLADTDWDGVSDGIEIQNGTNPLDPASAPTFDLTFTTPQYGSLSGAGSFSWGATATLTATPNAGYLFTGWTGDASGTENPLSLTISSNKTIGATFEQDLADGDGDGLSNYDEIAVYQTNPLNQDTDADGLNDDKEVLVHLTNPNLSDTDGDGYSDGEEIQSGFNPNDSSSKPQAGVAEIAVFDNGSFVDTVGSTSSESDNIQALLAAAGYKVAPFVGISDAEISTALTSKQVLVIPEMENGNLGAALDANACNVIRNYVSNGGGLIVHGSMNEYEETLLNQIFGFSLIKGSDVASGSSLISKTNAAGTQFAAGPATLAEANGTYMTLTSSLPAGSLAVYIHTTIPDNSAVARIPYGAGTIVMLSYDGFDAAPAGAQDGGWRQTIDLAVREVAKLGGNGSVFFDDFDPSYDSALWSDFGGTVTANTYAQAAGGGSTGNSLHFAGDGSRFATTTAMDLRDGGNVSFKFAMADGGSYPWENADGGEEVILEYSLDGISFVQFGGPYSNRGWQTYEVAIPAAAQSAATRLRWRQLENSGNDFDHWALEDLGVPQSFGSFTLALATDPMMGGQVTGAGTYAPSTTATLTATPYAGYIFTGWTGDASGTTNPLPITMDADKTVGATFAPDYGDTDGDGLSNYEEATVYYTDLNSSDSDGDGLQDGYELGLERFTIVMGSRTWAQAKAHAESQGGMLATFASREEWDIAMRSIGEDALPDLGGLWIGATDEATEGTWKWITGESLTFDLWETGQPDNFNNSDYAAVAGDLGGNMGRWYDFRSTSTRDGYLMESGYATSPTQYDSDGDNLSDGEEQIAGTNALVADSDGDGLNDWVEVELADTDPLRTDTDGNGISDGNEDKDGDGLSNYDEVTVYNTDIRSSDSDGDGFSDGEEVERGSGPNDGFSKPQVYLSFSSTEGGNIDASGIDYYSYWYYGSYSGNVQLRSLITLTAVPYPGYVFSGWIGDASGVANPLDLQMDDSKSIQANFGPDLADGDGDGLSNHAEIITYGSDPNLADSNGDGLRDGLVVALGKDPMENVSGFVSAIMANRTELGLHTTEDITDLRPGTMMIERAAGTNKLQFRMKLQKSNDMHNWQDDGEAVFEAPMGLSPAKQFYRFGVK